LPNLLPLNSQRQAFLSGETKGNFVRVAIGVLELSEESPIAVLVALSQNSTDSSYVTFEWAYALGKGKTVVPIRLESCKVHPRLEPIQYLDFSVPSSLPWNLLIERIREIEADATSAEDLAVASTVQEPSPLDPTVKAILATSTSEAFRW
jgi:hypothetical protein